MHTPRLLSGFERPSIALVLLVLFSVPASASSAPDSEPGWQDRFDLSACTWTATGRNTYMILDPGWQVVLEGEEDGEDAILAVTVLPETRRVAGVETRVVEEREWKDGKLVEVSRNFFALCGETGDIFYFGEDVDDYRDGKIIGHGSAWNADSPGCRPGMIMPGNPVRGARFYQEWAPKVALDRAEAVSLDERVVVPAGTFEKCLKIEETTPLEPDAKEYKLHAPGIGIIRDGALNLVRYGKAGSMPLTGTVRAGKSEGGAAYARRAKAAFLEVLNRAVAAEPGRPSWMAIESIDGWLFYMVTIVREDRSEAVVTLDVGTGKLVGVAPLERKERKDAADKKVPFKGTLSAKGSDDREYPYQVRVPLEEAIEIALRKYPGKLYEVYTYRAGGCLFHGVEVVPEGRNELLKIDVDAGNGKIANTEKM